MIDSQTGKHFITVLTGNEGSSLEITKEGLFYLRELELHNLQTRQSTFNKTLVIATFVLASFGYIQSFDTLIKILGDSEYMQSMLISILIGDLILLTFAMGYLLLSVYKLLFFDY